MPVENPKQTAIEENILKKMNELSLKTKDSFRMPVRPGYCTLGTGAWVRANFFPVKLPTGNIYKYDVKIEPAVKNARKAKRLYEILENHDAFNQYASCTATDYSKTIVSLKPLNPKASTTAAGEKDDHVEIKVIYTELDGEPLPPEGKGEYKFIIQRTNCIVPGDFGDYVAGRRPDYNAGEAIQALNVILAKFPSKSLTMVSAGKNRSKFFILSDNPSLTCDLGGGLVALRGFYTSIRPSVGNILCNVNVCTAAFYAPGNLVALMMGFAGARNGMKLSPDVIKSLRGFLRNLRVQSSHTRNKAGRVTTKGYTIRNISPSPPREMKFTMDSIASGSKQQITVEKYFKDHYNIPLKYPELPLINVGIDKPIWFPPEILEVLPGQIFREKINDNQTKVMINHACNSPKFNAELIENVGLPRLGLKGANSQLDPFGISVGTEMVEVPARHLNWPKVVYKNSAHNCQNASWNLQAKKFQTGGTMASWSYMIVEDGGAYADTAEIEDTVKLLHKVCLDYGINVKPPRLVFPDGKKPLKVSLPPIPVSKRLQKDLVKALKPAFELLVRHQIGVVYVFLPSANKHNYAAVKYCGDMKAGIATVCSQWENIRKSKRLEQYLANVALKFNIKTGGINHSIAGLWSSNKKVMLVGCDVTHPSPGSAKGVPSIAGVVASTDAAFAQYPASLRLQESRKEMITEIKEMIVERLRLWAKRNKNTYPDIIIIYRDGVSEAQYNHVLDQELPQVKEACLEIDPRYNPKISVIIVGKRHHARFFPTQRNDDSGNCRPGTLVDRVVTSVHDFDFYLQSHQGLKGTARPAHYYVVYDENKFQADDLHNFTHNLCYLFGRATKGVSICPPAYYADLVCERGRCYIHGLLTNEEGQTSTSLTDEQQKALTLVKARGLWENGVHSRLRDTMYYL
jgi:eukaryotic translation initiation factor 2C